MCRVCRWAQSPLPSDEGARGNNVRGPGTIVNSVHTQFYSMEAFSSQKAHKTFVFLNFPRFPRILEKKLWRGKIIVGKPGKRPQAHFRVYGRNPAISAQSCPITPGKKCFCMKSTTRKWSRAVSGSIKAKGKCWFPKLWSQFSFLKAINVNK